MFQVAIATNDPFLRCEVYSLSGQAKTIEDVEKRAKSALTVAGEDNTYRISYAVHRIIEPKDDSSTQAQAATLSDQPTEFLGLVVLKSLGPRDLPLPEYLGLPTADETTTVVVELAYMFLPSSWGKGYAPEALPAVFDACSRAPAFWAPYKKLYIRVIVNEHNPRSQRVIQKAGVPQLGTYDWSGDPIWMAGEWITQNTIHIFGKYLF